jgi:Flp pilus assembly pilin Flp
MRKRVLSQRGQGIVEYILITALVALAAITIFKAFRADVSTAYRKAGDALVRGVDDGLASNSGSNE